MRQRYSSNDRCPSRHGRRHTDGNLNSVECSPKKPLKILTYIITAILVLGIIASIVVVTTAAPEKAAPRGAVVTNGYGCASIGASILNKGGSAVDAAIAALFCEGVSMPQSMGLGGGFLMTIYVKETGEVKSLNARETAPLGATQDMFRNRSSEVGGLAVAVPGELKGYWMAYNKYGGKVAWKELVQPTIDLCRNGILVTEYLAKVYSDTFETLYKDPYLREAFIDPKTNRSYTVNQKVKRLRLAKTLEIIADEGADALYNGTLTEGFVKDIQDAGGIITKEDMVKYTAEWQDPIKIDLPFGQTLYTAPLPGSGVVLGFIMNILNNFLDYSAPLSITNWQRIIESFKFGYGKRTELGDMNFVSGVGDLVANLTSMSYAAGIREKIFDNQTNQNQTYYGANTSLVEDHGTAHISVLAPNGDAVSVTSTINLYFGAKFMSPSTGIILNDEMDDFSSPFKPNYFGVPPSEANYIEPMKRPLSSMSPSIVLGENGRVRTVIGGAGGTKITTSVALVLISDLWFNKTIEEAVTEKRLHHQLLPMLVEFEEPYENDPDFIEKIHEIGHEYKISPTTGFSALTAITSKENHIRMASDSRRPGEATFVY